MMIGQLCSSRLSLAAALSASRRCTRSRAVTARVVNQRRLRHAAAAGAGTQHTDADAAAQPKKEPIAKQMDDRLHAYLVQHTREPPVLVQLRRETEAAFPVGARMLVPPEQGQFMALLIEALGVRRAVEVGVFTGYSSTVVAMGLPEDGMLVACDRDPRAMEVARKYWQQAGVAHKIQERLAPAAESLQRLLDEGQADTFDFAFIDADKRATAGYYEQMLCLVRRGGVIAIDNVLFRGRVADPEEADKKVAALRDFNAQLLADERVTLSIIPVGDGLALCRKR